MKRAAVLLSGLLAAVLLFAACGGSAVATTPPKPRATSTPVPSSAGPTAAPTAAATSAPADDADFSGESVRLDISVNGDALEFDKEQLSVAAGSRVILTLSNVSTINQHNWVITQAGAIDDVTERGTLHPTTDWVQPGDSDVIANTKLLDPGITGEVGFFAPSPGIYQFVCTFPAHNITMFGAFEVTS